MAVLSFLAFGKTRTKTRDARLTAARAALDRIDELADEQWTRTDTAQRMRGLYEYRAQRFEARVAGDEVGDYEERSRAYQDMVRAVLEAQRRALMTLRREGSRSNEAFNRILRRLRPQARVAHLDKSSDLFFELLFGVSKANAVMVSVNWRLAAPEILHIVNDAEAEILFVGEEYFPVIESIRDRLTKVRRIVSLGGGHADCDRRGHCGCGGEAEAPLHADLHFLSSFRRGISTKAT